MIFQHTFENVLSQTKTQTRRLIKPQDQAIRGRYNKIQAITASGRLKWVVGRTYAVQTGRGEPSIARVEITRITSQTVKYISSKDAIAEGFINRADFFETWQNIHGENSLEDRVWIVEFQLVAIEAKNYPIRKLADILQE